MVFIYICIGAYFADFVVLFEKKKQQQWNGLKPHMVSSWSWERHILDQVRRVCKTLSSNCEVRHEFCTKHLHLPSIYMIYIEEIRKEFMTCLSITVRELTQACWEKKVQYYGNCARTNFTQYSSHMACMGWMTEIGICIMACIMHILNLIFPIMYLWKLHRDWFWFFSRLWTRTLNSS